MTLQPVRRFDLDAAILFADILLMPHALGQKVWFAEGEGPRLEPVRDMRGAGEACPIDAAKLAPVMQTIKGVRAALPDDAALIGFAGAPWTVATYMIEGQGGTDHETSRTLAWTEPEFFARLMDILVEATSAYLIAQADAGAEALQLFESWAGTVPAGLLQTRGAGAHRPHRQGGEGAASPHSHHRLSARRAAPGWRDYAEATGVDGIGIDQMTDMAALQALPPNIALQGNLDPELLLQGGDAMRARSADAGRGDGGPAFHLQSRPWRDAADAAGACRRTGGCRSRGCKNADGLSRLRAASYIRGLKSLSAAFGDLAFCQILADFRRHHMHVGLAA